MCKSRVAPRETQTLPRLELLAALICVRLRRYLGERFGIDFASVRYYTDSRIAYHWATSSRPGAWKQFVSNRVTEIQSCSAPAEWFHVQGACNVSDLATRGIPAETLITCKDWWFGPSWLRLPVARQSISQPNAESSTLEQVGNEARRIAAPAVAMLPLINLDRYSTAGRAVRVAGFELKLTYLARRREAPCE